MAYAVATEYACMATAARGFHVCVGGPEFDPRRMYTQCAHKLANATLQRGVRVRVGVGVGVRVRNGVSVVAVRASHAWTRGQGKGPLQQGTVGIRLAA